MNEKQMKEKKIEGAIPGDITLQDFDLPLGHFCQQQTFAAICSKATKPPSHQATKQATPVSSPVACEVEAWQAAVEDRASGEPGPPCSPSSC